MSVRYLGFLLLVWFTGVLHAQSAAQPCTAPSLRYGYLVPEQHTYFHETTLTYSCDYGRKPAVEGWWATSTCRNGTWFHKPQCIDEKACLPPTVPNAKYTENQKGWYEDGHKIRITCEKGYEHKNKTATSNCMNGTWSSVPVCEKSSQSCHEPPKIPHAVIILQRYQEVFAVDSEVQYECEDGYTVEGADSKKSILCIAGNWTEATPCSTGHGVSTVGRTGGGHTSSAGMGTQPAGEETIPVSNCGTPPTVPNGEVVKTGHMFLKYQCGSFYTQVGPAAVVCYSDGTWSEVPTCRATFCSVDTNEYPALEPAGVKILKNGESETFKCKDLWIFKNYSVGRCADGRMTFTRCKYHYERIELPSVHP
ncbi:complement factor H-related protein 1-like [Micropterus dolomieu]|uniref:complement factor H-related protein 1-like n=1 Tax=Micropterus dolomieu TaxID=147949 RepID=UPI001E8DA57D|nr:complement factor H-related protein 1-like [Micropterus dolomieu]